MNKAACAAVVWCLYCVLSGCMPTAPKRDEIPGTYSLSHAFGEELLELKSDYVFHQVLKLAGGVEVENTGKWEMKAIEGLPQAVVKLRGGKLFADSAGNYDAAAKAEVVELYVDRSWGVLELKFSPNHSGFVKK